MRSKVLVAALGTITALGWTMSSLAAVPTSVNRERLRPQPFFERNDGQADPEALYLTSGAGYSTRLERNGVTNNCSTVAAGNNCTLQVSFSPTAAGSRNGTLTITDDSITSPETLTLSGMGTDFNFPPPTGSTSQTVSAGQTATYTLTVNSQGGSETVSFSCSGLPALSSCAFTPSSTTLTGTPQNVTVNISTTAASTALKIPETPLTPPLLLWAITAALSVVILRMRKRMKRAVFAGMCFSVLLIACGGGGGSSGVAVEEGIRERRVYLHGGGHCNGQFIAEPLDQPDSDR